MSARPLKSDQVNYLIWRYLQESGHAQTAARLQRDWGRGDPQRLPFAQHIRTHALIHLLQKGLRYHELETSIDQNGQRKSASSFFGPDSAATSPPQIGVDDEDAANSRKHLNDIDAAAQAPSAKRTRRNNGTVVNGRSRGADGMDVDSTNHSPNAELISKREAGTTNTSATTPTSVANNVAQMEMEFDSKVNAETNLLAESAYPNRADASTASETAAGETADGSGGTVADAQQQQQQQQQQLPNEAQASGDESPAQQQAAGPVINIVPTLVNGSSVGVQSDKGAELGPETGVLGLPGKNVTHALWNPRDPSLLAAAGDALCHLWTLPTTISNPPNGFPKPHLPRTIDPLAEVDLNENRDAYYVTSIAWSDDGQHLAVAKHPTTAGQLGVVGIYDKGGVMTDELPGGQDLVLNLLWNPQSTSLLGISHSDENSSSVNVWDITGARIIPPLKVNRTVWDASWVDDRQFWMCAHSYVGKGEVEASGIKLVSEKSGDGLAADWSRIEHDAHSGTLTLTSDGSTGLVGGYDPTGYFEVKEAHSAEITSLTYQPLANPYAARAQNAPRLVATSSIDGSIKLWNALKHLDIVHTFDMGRESPALAVSFTPDGYLVAGASSDKILFWNAETGGFPKISWYAKDAGWSAGDEPHVNGNGHAIENGDIDMKDADEEDALPTLGWDADGKKLALAIKNKLVVISLRR